MFYRFIFKFSLSLFVRFLLIFDVLIILFVIAWWPSDLLAFRLCCFTLRLLNCLCSFPVGFLGQDAELDCIGS